MYFNIDKIPTKIITSNYNYKNANLIYFTKYHMEFMNRFLYYILAIVMVAAFMLLVPRGKTIYTRFGSRTLQVYILHRFLYLAELKWGWYEPFIDATGWWWLFLIAVMVTVTLSLEIFEIPFKALNKLDFKWLLKKESSNTPSKRTQKVVKFNFNWFIREEKSN